MALAYPSIKFMSFRIIHDPRWWRPDHGLQLIRDSAYSVVHSAAGEPVQLIVQDKVPDPTRRSRNNRYTFDLRPKVNVLSKWRRALASRLDSFEKKGMRRFI